jgi:hypothetical protein
MNMFVVAHQLQKHYDFKMCFKDFEFYVISASYSESNRQVSGSIPDGVIGIFQLHNPSGRTMVLGSTQPLIEMSTRCISLWVKAAGV